MAPGAGGYRPGMGGAIGGAFAAIATELGATPEHKTYSVQLKDGSIKPAPVAADFDIGQCVDAFVPKSLASAPYWKFGEITLKPSTSCSD